MSPAEQFVADCCLKRKHSYGFPFAIIQPTTYLTSQSLVRVNTASAPPFSGLA
ncbi:hypothetical protein IC582_021347 [Cucumis melo]